MTRKAPTVTSSHTEASSSWARVTTTRASETSTRASSDPNQMPSHSSGSHIAGVDPDHQRHHDGGGQVGEGHGGEGHQPDGEVDVAAAGEEGHEGGGHGHLGQVGGQVGHQLERRLAADAAEDGQRDAHPDQRHGDGSEQQQAHDEGHGREGEGVALAAQLEVDRVELGQHVEDGHGDGHDHRA